MTYKFTDPPPEDWKGPDGDRYILMLMRETPEWGLSRIRLAEELEGDVERLRKAIQTVLDDNETGAGGWGPDVTMAEVLRVAIEGES